MPASDKGPYADAAVRVNGYCRRKRPSLYPSSIPQPSASEPTFDPTGAATAASLFANVVGQPTRPTSFIDLSTGKSGFCNQARLIIAADATCRSALSDADLKPQELDRLIPLHISKDDEAMMRRSYPGIDVSGWLQEISCEESSDGKRF